MEDMVETFELVLFILIAVLFSSVLENIIPKVSTPLIQIALGAIAALLAITPLSVTLNPDFFLPIFIAPLLFNDAKHADKAALWKNRGTIVSLAIGLVIAIMLAVGFMMHAIIPSLPLAAAFALGAALGPTDAVAVSSLKASAKLKRDDAALLQGESLINDASGVVAFQFTIAAAVTGTFSLLDASVTFAIQFIGGIAFGLVCGWLAQAITKFLFNEGLNSPSFHVTFDVILPFLIYIASEMIHVGGILAVVTAGMILTSFRSRNNKPVSAQTGVVSASVWSVLEFVLNGIVFVLLGMQLPQVFQQDWTFGRLSTSGLILISLVITALLIVVRLIWVIVTAHMAKNADSGTTRWQQGGMRSALVTTIGGAKGAVTLAVILSIPMAVETGDIFPGRDMMISIASIVILFTLLLANFLLPILAPRPHTNKDQTEQNAQAGLLVLRRVVQRLPELAHVGNERALTTVSHTYNQRIAHVREETSEEETPTLKLRIDVINEQIDQIQGSVDGGKIDVTEGMQFIHMLEHARTLLEQKERECEKATAKQTHAAEKKMRRNTSHGRPSIRVRIQSLLRHIYRRMTGTYKEDTEQTALIARSQQHAITYLKNLQKDGSEYPAEVVNEVLTQYASAYRRTKKKLDGGVQSEFTSLSEQISSIQSDALGLELEEIRKALDSGEITSAQARHLRENVYTMRMDLETNFI